MEGKSLIDIVGFIASIASLILAIVAIWLSIVFYKMSDAASKATTEAAKGIGASVERLEKLFDKLYSDTFTMMKDTVTDMRKHIWRAPQSDEGIDAGVKEEITKQISSVLDKQNDGPKNREDLAKKLEKAFEEILAKSGATSLGVAADNDEVLNAARKMKTPTPQKIAEIMNVKEESVGAALFHLRKEGLVRWSGPSNQLSSDTTIRLVQKPEESDG